MSALNMYLHIGSFNLYIQLDKDIRTNNNNLGRKWQHENRINDAIQKGKDTQVKYSFFNILF